MKKTALLIVSLCCLLPMWAPAAENPLMRVSAEAEVRVKPDRAAITFGLFEKTDNLRQGTERLNTTAAQVNHYLHTRGIEDRFIQTDNLQILPVYTLQTAYGKNGVRTESEKLQYQISQTFTVTLDDPSQYEDVLYALLDMGINRIENISFYSTQIRQHRDQARRLAVQYAREKAALLAEAADIRLGKIVDVSENALPAYPSARFMTSNISQNIVQPDLPADIEQTPATGMIPVKAAVTLTYKIK